MENPLARGFTHGYDLLALFIFDSLFSWLPLFRNSLLFGWLVRVIMWLYMENDVSPYFWKLEYGGTQNFCIGYVNLIGAIYFYA